MMENALNWAQANGPPNWLFVVALLTAPRLWAEYIKKAVSDYYERHYGDTQDS